MSKSVRIGVIGVACAAVVGSSLIGAAPRVTAAPAAATVGAGVESLGPIAVVSGTGVVAPVLPVSVVRGGVALSPRPILILPSDATSATQVEVVDISAGRSGWSWQGQVRAGRVTIGKDVVSGHAYSWSWRDSSSAQSRAGGTFVAKYGVGTSQSAVGVGSASVDPLTGEAGVSWSSDTVAGPQGTVSATLEWRASRVDLAADAGVTGIPAGWRLGVTSGSQWVGVSESRDAIVRGVAPGMPRALLRSGELNVAWRFPVGAARGFDIEAKNDKGRWVTVHSSTASTTSESYSIAIAAPNRVSVGAKIRVIAQVGKDGMNTRFLLTSGVEVSSPVGRITDQAVRAVVSPATPVGGSGAGSDVVSGEAPRSVSVWGWDGSALTFVRNASGVYEQVLTAASDVAGARNALDRRLIDGEWAWELTDSSGVVTRFVDGYAVSVARGSMPLSTLNWSGDQLISVRPGGVALDASRALGFSYSGTSDCASDAWTTHGFVKAPEGMLCRITYGNGMATDIGYVDGVAGGAQIALLKDAGNQAMTLGWDSVGHLVATRSALVSKSALVSPTLVNLIAGLEYDDRGRAAVLREAAPSMGANRLVQRLTFPQISENAAIVGAKVIAKVDSSVGVDAWSKTVEFDASAQVVTGGTDRAGNKVTVVTDKFGRPQRIVDPEKRITTYAYDEAGLQTGQAGPFAGDAAKGLVLDANYDSTVDGSRTVAWTGMNARVFTRADYAGDASGAWWGKNDRSGLGFSWTSVPDGAQGQWSGRATAKWTPTSNARDWALRVDSNGAQVSVLIDGELCVADNSGRCEITGLTAGAKSVVVQVNKASARGGFRVLAAPLGDEPALIPAAQVEPLFGVATAQALNDTYPGSERNPQTVKEFSKPWDEVVSSTTTPGGLTMEQTVEDIDPANSQWGRPLTRTTPGGKATTFSYYANDGAVAAPEVCGGGAAAPQYGATKSVTRQDGTSEQRIFNTRGQIIAKVTNGVAGSAQTTCIGYDESGQLVSTRILNTAGALIEATVTDLDVDGKPWITSTKVTHGPASPVTPGATYTSTTEVDMAGRVVRYTDGLGTITTTTYTDEGKPKVVVITAPSTVSGAGRVMRFGFTYTDVQDWLSTVTLNGTRVAKVNYDANIGRVQSVEYADGVSVSYEYFGNGRPDKQTIVHPGGRVVNAVDFKGTGRSMGSTVNSTGSSSWMESRQYGYDEAGRLVSTVIASTQPGVPASTNFTYNYGAQAGVCAAGYTGAGADSLRVGGSRNGVDYTTCHNSTGQTTSTTDPLITGGSGTATLTHDRQGRVTRIESAGNNVSMTWGAGTQLATLTDGDTVTTLNTFAGLLRDKTVTTATTSSRIAYGYSGPAADPAAKSDGSSDPLASAAPSPTMTYAMTGNVATSVASAFFDLPGGAQVAIPAGAKAVMTLSDVEGASLFTVPLASLGAGAASDLVSAVGPAPRFGPYGEALVVPTFTTATPHYGWQNSSGMDTLAGSSSITLMGVRPYLPALGEFLAKDPDFNSGMNLYSYTSGDPINRQDLSGESETLNTVSLWMGVAGMLAGFFGPAGMAIGALAAIGSAVVQGIAIAQQDEKPSVAQWIGVGATAFFGVVGGWSSIKALKDLKWFVSNKSRTLKAADAGFSTKNKAVTGACIFSWGCAAAIRTEGARVRQWIGAENAVEANRGLMQGGVIQGRKGFFLRLFAPGG
ncbi:MAG: hypothetical protein NT180_04790 [Actinobacteria bacterium]|nr:hypothetical protein [Actinomycetota bacterium]